VTIHDVLWNGIGSRVRYKNREGMIRHYTWVGRHRRRFTVAVQFDDGTIIDWFSAKNLILLTPATLHIESWGERHWRIFSSKFTDSKKLGEVRERCKLADESDPLNSELVPDGYEVKSVNQNAWAGSFATLQEAFDSFSGTAVLA